MRVSRFVSRNDTRANGRAGAQESTARGGRRARTTFLMCGPDGNRATQRPTGASGRDETCGGMAVGQGSSGRRPHGETPDRRCGPAGQTHRRGRVLSLALIHKVIAFYLENQVEVDKYLVRCEVLTAEQRATGPPGPDLAELRRRAAQLTKSAEWKNQIVYVP